jgi:integrase
MARRKQAPKDLPGIRQRGGTYQVRLFGGLDPVTGKQVMLTGSAEDEDAAIMISG